MILDVKKTRIAPLQPQSDGMVDRINKTINGHLTKVVFNHQPNWDVYTMKKY